MDLHDQRGHSADSIFDCSCVNHRIRLSVQITEPIHYYFEYPTSATGTSDAVWLWVNSAPEIFE